MSGGSGLRMEFEFDRTKSESNRAKHGIDFVDVQALWDDKEIKLHEGK